MRRDLHMGTWPALIGAAAMLLAGSVAYAKEAKEKVAKAKGKPATAGIKTTDKWGVVDGKDVSLYTLTNKNGLVANITNYGAIITELQVPDKKGKLGDIVFGYDNVADYVKKTPYFGATVGRICNRVAGAQFSLEGKTYKLAANNGPNNLHGGKKGWDKVIWTAEPLDTPKGPALKLTYVSKDGEEGFPGTVTATTIYTLTNDNELKVEMGATTDKTTIINMCHHSYFNLHGSTEGDIQDHLLTLSADKYTPGLPPDGKIAPVEGTPFDFTKPKLIGKDLKAAGSPGMDAPIGYDSNWIVNGDAKKMRPVARLEDPKSGRVMTVEADQAGVQFYAGIFMDGTTKGKGRTHAQYSALCIETQQFPNAINVPAWRDQVILKPGQTYSHNMIHKFTVK